MLDRKRYPKRRYMYIYTNGLEKEYWNIGITALCSNSTSQTSSPPSACAVDHSGLRDEPVLSLFKNKDEAHSRNVVYAVMPKALLMQLDTRTPEVCRILHRYILATSAVDTRGLGSRALSFSTVTPW